MFQGFNLKHKNFASEWDLLSLIYVSVAQDDITQKQVEALAVHSARNNAAQNVTGLLAYNTRRFMQLLEGEPDAVMGIMRAIQSDTRHKDVSIIRQERRTKRECPTWSMQSLIMPLTGVGSADAFVMSLPQQMDMDTKVLFTSFASAQSAFKSAGSLSPRSMAD